MDKSTHVNFWYVLIAVFCILFFQQWWYERQIVEAVPYSEFLTLLDDGQLLEIQVSDTEIRGRLRNAGMNSPEFISTVRIDDDIVQLLTGHDVEYTGVIESDTFSNIIALILPTALFIGVWIFIIRNMAAGCKTNKGPFPSHPAPSKRRWAHFASRARRESSPHPVHCREIRPSIAGFPANGCSRTSRHPVEAVSDRNVGKAGTFRRISRTDWLVAAREDWGSVSLNPAAISPADGSLSS